MIVCCPVAMSLTWHLAPGLANSKGEGGLTSSGNHVADCDVATWVPVVVASCQ